MAIDLIYDRVVAEEKLKTGTKYERLAAMVFKLLSDPGDHVVHDLRLTGARKRTRHQIDVTITNQQRTSRILVECKDIDRKVPLRVARDFRGVTVQLQPDRAVIVTKVGFTGPALGYCQEEGIELAILREFRDEDWDGFIRSVDVALVAVGRTNPKVLSVVIPPENLAEVQRDLATHDLLGQQMVIDRTEMFFDEHGNVIGPVLDVLAPKFQEMPSVAGQETQADVAFDRVYHLKLSGVDIPVAGARLAITGTQMVHNIHVDAGVAVLIYRSILGQDVDRAVFEKDLRRLHFDERGEVTL